MAVMPAFSAIGSFLGSMGGVGNILSGIGGLLGLGDSNDAAKMQMRAAKNAIQWRVADARKAGIHPLYALGAPGISIAPTGGDYGFLSEMGQNIDRAKYAAADRQERLAAAALTGRISPTQMTADKLQLENMSLQNDMLRANIASSIARLNGSQVPPAFPSMDPLHSGAGVSASERVQPLPAQPVINAPGTPSREAGDVTAWSYARTALGGLQVVPSMDMKNRIEDSPMELMWWWNNNLVPNFSADVNDRLAPSVREYPLPAGFDEWHWDAGTQSYRPYRYRRGDRNPTYYLPPRR